MKIQKSTNKERLKEIEGLIGQSEEVLKPKREIGDLR